MLRRLFPRADVEVGIAIPIGCLVPVGALVALVAAGVLVATHLQPTTSLTVPSVVVRVIDDGAQGGPAVLATSVVPLR